MVEIITYLELFWVFFITNFLGYGGGPATIPLVQHEVVEVYSWMTEYEFIEMLAAGNALPGPIATKMAGSIGFGQGGIIGATLTLIATVVPSLILKILLMNFLVKHKNSPRVKRLALYIKPAIAVLLGVIMIQNFTVAFETIGIFHLIILTLSAWYFLEKKKTHPSLVILGALIYGGVMGMFG
ncbi:MAG: chromate transporter [Defluviitaleaceae bacterium]|nr:chromate transporter [Defluviitaleaceae bacterium]